VHLRVAHIREFCSHKTTKNGTQTVTINCDNKSICCWTCPAAIHQRIADAGAVRIFVALLTREVRPDGIAPGESEVRVDLASARPCRFSRRTPERLAGYSKATTAEKKVITATGMPTSTSAERNSSARYEFAARDDGPTVSNANMSLPYWSGQPVHFCCAIPA
jgi:hypothetical protein